MPPKKAPSSAIEEAKLKAAAEREARTQAALERYRSPSAGPRLPAAAPRNVLPAPAPAPVPAAPPAAPKVAAGAVERADGDLVTGKKRKQRADEEEKPPAMAPSAAKPAAATAKKPQPQAAAESATVGNKRRKAVEEVREAEESSDEEPVASKKAAAGGKKAAPASAAAAASAKGAKKRRIEQEEEEEKEEEEPKARGRATRASASVAATPASNAPKAKSKGAEAPASAASSAAPASASASARGRRGAGAVAAAKSPAVAKRLEVHAEEEEEEEDESEEEEEQEAPAAKRPRTGSGSGSQNAAPAAGKAKVKASRSPPPPPRAPAPAPVPQPAAPRASSAGSTKKAVPPQPPVQPQVAPRPAPAPMPVAAPAARGSSSGPGSSKKPLPQPLPPAPIAPIAVAAPVASRAPPAAAASSSGFNPAAASRELQAIDRKNAIVAAPAAAPVVVDNRSKARPAPAFVPQSAPAAPIGRQPPTSFSAPRPSRNAAAIGAAPTGEKAPAAVPPSHHDRAPSSLSSSSSLAAFVNSVRRSKHLTLSNVIRAAIVGFLLLLVLGGFGVAGTFLYGLFNPDPRRQVETAILTLLSEEKGLQVCGFPPSTSPYDFASAGSAVSGINASLPAVSSGCLDLPTLVARLDGDEQLSGSYLHGTLVLEPGLKSLEWPAEAPLTMPAPEARVWKLAGMPFGEAPTEVTVSALSGALASAAATNGPVPTRRALRWADTGALVLSTLKNLTNPSSPTYHKGVSFHALNLTFAVDDKQAARPLVCIVREGFMLMFEMLMQAAWTVLVFTLRAIKLFVVRHPMAFVLSMGSGAAALYYVWRQAQRSRIEQVVVEAMLSKILETIGESEEGEPLSLPVLGAHVRKLVMREPLAYGLPAGVTMSEGQLVALWPDVLRRLRECTDTVEVWEEDQGEVDPVTRVKVPTCLIAKRPLSPVKKPYGGVGGIAGAVGALLSGGKLPQAAAAVSGRGHFSPAYSGGGGAGGRVRDSSLGRNDGAFRTPRAVPLADSPAAAAVASPPSSFLKRAINFIGSTRKQSQAQQQLQQAIAVPVPVPAQLPSAPAAMPAGIQVPAAIRPPAYAPHWAGVASQAAAAPAYASGLGYAPGQGHASDYAAPAASMPAPSAPPASAPLPPLYFGGGVAAGAHPVPLPADMVAPGASNASKSPFAKLAGYFTGQR